MVIMTVVVTGGAGFIGSTLVKKLVDEGRDVVVIDNLSSGSQDNIPDEADFYNINLNSTKEVEKVLENVDRVYHLAANADVKVQNEDRDKDINEGIIATRSLLEAMYSAGVKDLVFTSSSTVYGEDVEVPTPETYGVMEPISLYGSAKLSAEAIISAYSHSFGFESSVLRLANIIGGRSEKSVTYDFVKKLEDDSSELEVLGNGKQKKSYIHVDDCVNAIVTAARNREDSYEVYNVGNEDSVSVTNIAEAVIDEYSSDTEIYYTGGEKGWTGDVPVMLLDIEKIKEELDWSPSMNSEEAVRKNAREVIEKQN
jgi:UDP-glucose 4-epimerase